MTIRLSISSVLIALVLATSPSAAATSVDSETIYRQHYDDALNLYSAGQYDDAIKAFYAAYAVKPRPILLFNIGQSHRRLGNYREALNYYLKYKILEPAPNPELRAELEGYITQMQRLLGIAENLKTDPPPPPPPPPLLPPPPPPPPERKPFYKRGWFWGVAGGGTAVLVVALSVGLTAGHSDVPVFHW